MRVLGLDVGEKRIGVAKADSSTRIAIPVGYVNVDGTEFEEIAKLVRFNNISLFVLGLPRSNQGNETNQSLYVRNFAKTLSNKIPDIKIRFQDESLTSVEAETRLKSRKKVYEKGDIDAEAASIILQDFIENFQEKEITGSKPVKTPTKPTKKPQEIIDKSTKIVKKNAEKVMLNSKKVTSKSKKVIRAILIPPLIIAIIGIFAVGGFFWYKDSLAPIIKNCTETRCEDISFVVEDGETVDKISKKLEEEGIIKSAFFFKAYHKIEKHNETLKSGKYTLNKGLSTQEIIEILIAGTKESNVFNFTIVPGETIFNVKKKLQEIGYASSEIESAFSKQYDFDMLKKRPEGASLEGFLFGETYEFYSNATVETILETFLRKMDETIRENDLEAAYSKQGLTLFEGITLASIIQKESYPAEQPTVAQVFLLRKKKNWKLGSDVTASYAADIIDPERKVYTSNAAILNIDSCYNTRKNIGLPCGPIASPSKSALLAVANPADTSYLYFLTGDDGKMYYSYTDAEHQKNARDHCKVLCGVSL